MYVKLDYRQQCSLSVLDLQQYRWCCLFGSSANIPMEYCCTRKIGTAVLPSLSFGRTLPCSHSTMSYSTPGSFPSEFNDVSSTYDITSLQGCGSLGSPGPLCMYSYLMYTPCCASHVRSPRALRGVLLCPARALWEQMRSQPSWETSGRTRRSSAMEGKTRPSTSSRLRQGTCP